MSVDIVTSAISFVPVNYMVAKMKDKVEEKIVIESPKEQQYVLNLGDVADMVLDIHYYPPQWEFSKICSLKRRKTSTFAGLEIRLDGTTVFPAPGIEGLVEITQGKEIPRTIVPIVATTKKPGPEETRELEIIAYHERQTRDGETVVDVVRTKEVIRRIAIKIHNPFGVLSFTINGKRTEKVEYSSTKTNIPLAVRLSRNPMKDPNGMMVRPPSSWNYKFRVSGIPNPSSVKEVVVEPAASADPTTISNDGEFVEVKAENISLEDGKAMRISIYYDHVAMKQPTSNSAIINLTTDTEVWGKSKAIARRGNIESPFEKEWSSKVNQPVDSIKSETMEVQIEYC